MSIYVDSNADAVADMYDKEESLLKKIRSVHLPAFAQDVISTARSNIQNNQSVYRGDLNASYGIQASDEDSISVGTTLPYARFVEYGRGIVRAINKKFLHFFLKDGTEIFTKEAGPAAPRPFHEPALIEAWARFKKRILEARVD